MKQNNLNFNKTNSKEKFKKEKNYYLKLFNFYEGSGSGAESMEKLSGSTTLGKAKKMYYKYLLYLETELGTVPGAVQ